MTDERRARYAAVISRYFGYLPYADVLVHRATDAAMAVADAEIDDTIRSVEKVGMVWMHMYEAADAENARLRAALDRLNVAYDKLEEAFYEQ